MWYHVPTKDNPADCASRGLNPRELVDHALWWSGPTWLKQSPEHWPKSCSPPSVCELSTERRITVNTCVVPDSWDLATRYSSWPKLLRVTAYLFRFVNTLRSKCDPHVEAFVEPQSSAVLPHELQTAKIFWLQTLQAESFPQEILSLTGNHRVANKSPLIALNPYLDPDKLIRVGGRLARADLPVSVKHPIVLRSHPLFTLIISHHGKTLHGGPQLTLAYLRTEFWILCARATIRVVLYRCVRYKTHLALARRWRYRRSSWEISDVRVNPSSRAFEHAGIDYAGPIFVRTASGRDHKAHKAYIALFICMCMKAIHLELVSDYSSAAFLACFNRFVSRRGIPHSMYSDRGTTFQGADRELVTAYNAAVRDSVLLNKLSIDRVAFPPPRGAALWEAGVRIVKHHLKRCVGSHTLTYEEMNTLLCRIEACLNSKPLASTSDHPDDYNALTPGHFLIGANLMAVPEPSVLELPENRLSRWQLVQRATEIFWKAWVNDYLHTLQQRPKWRVVCRLAKVGRIVLMRNPLALPNHWELGRITACHPGADGLTRVVTVKTARSEYRPIVKFCFLPIDINTETEGDDGKAGGL